MEFSTWFTFMLAVWGIALSPGNGAVLCMSHGLSYGLRQSTATILGLQLGVFIILLISALGLGALLLASETAFTVVKWLGAAYLVWLGIQLWRAPVLGSNGIATVAPMSARKRFMLGLFTNVTNPKGIVFMVAVLPGFMNPQSPNRALEIAILALTMFAIDCVVMHGYAGLAARLAVYFKNPTALRWQNRLFGGVLIAVGVGVLLVKRQASAT
jgi:homoserine/homoserine lactone efflux protein